MSIDHFGITIANFLTIRWYGILLMVGALAGAFLAEYLAKKKGLNPEKVWDGFLWVLILGVVFARVWHILFPPDSMLQLNPPENTLWYLTHPIDAVNITRGGLGWPGAVIGGALGLWIFIRRNRLSFPVWADIAVPGVALGQAIGRWGNFFNFELYGQPSNLPWAKWFGYIPPEYRLPNYVNEATYHPLFLYESLLDLVNFGILLFLALSKRTRGWIKTGDLILLYIMNYGIIRFCLEFLRLDKAPVAGIDVNQVVAGAAALICAGWFVWRHWGRAWWLRRTNPEAYALLQAETAEAATTREALTDGDTVAESSSVKTARKPAKRGTARRQTKAPPARRGKTAK